MTKGQPGSRSRRGQQNQDPDGHDYPPAGRARPALRRPGLDTVRARAGQRRDLAGLIRLGRRRIWPEQAVEEIVIRRRPARFAWSRSDRGRPARFGRAEASRRVTRIPGLGTALRRATR